MKKEKLLEKIINSRNVKFSELVKCARAFGFVLNRVSGSHHIFTHKNVSELLNLQNVNGNAKPYQIKQFLSLVEKYNLKMEIK